jgi:outer membrane protein
MKRLLLIFIVSTALFRVTSARNLSLEEALNLAEQHSFELKQARAETEAAEQSLEAARAERHPSLVFNGSAFYRDYVAKIFFADPTGTETEREFGTHDNFQFDLRLNAPLWTGGRIGSAVDAAEASRDLTQALRDSDIDRVHLHARIEYLSQLQATSVMRSMEASLDRTRVIQRDIESLYAAGAADSVDILESHLAITEAEFAVDRATSYLRSNEIRLLVLLGLDLTESLTLISDLPEPAPLTTTDSVSGTKPELAAALAGIGLSESQVNQSQSEYWPVISAFAGYSYGKPNIDLFRNTWHDYFAIGAQLSWSLNLFGAKARNSSSAYTLEASWRDYDRVVEHLSREAELTYEQLKLAFTQYVSARREHDITSSNYRLATEKHRAGMLSSNRLLEIETTLTSAESSVAAAKVNYFIAQSQYLHAIGSDRLKEGL